MRCTSSCFESRVSRCKLAEASKWRAFDATTDGAFTIVPFSPRWLAASSSSQKRKVEVLASRLPCFLSGRAIIFLPTTIISTEVGI